MKCRKNIVQPGRAIEKFWAMYGHQLYGARMTVQAMYSIMYIKTPFSPNRLPTQFWPSTIGYIALVLVKSQDFVHGFPAKLYVQIALMSATENSHLSTAGRYLSPIIAILHEI